MEWAVQCRPGVGGTLGATYISSAGNRGWMMSGPSGSRASEVPGEAFGRSTGGRPDLTHRRRPAYRPGMRRLATAALLAATVWLPTVLMPPVVQGAVCTGWSSTTAPPPAIRVLRSATGVVQSVDFETYVKVVMPAEWPSTWPMESLRAGAVAIKQYAWYYAIHYRGGTGTGGCYDVADNTNDQVYKPETYTPAASHIQAVESTWSESITKNGSFIPTGYQSGSDVACGADADGSHLYQHSARHCALDGRLGEEILHVYFDPGMAILGTYAPTTYVPITPARLLDTRAGNGLSGRFVANTPRTFQVRGRGGVPERPMAITGNVTVVRPTAS